MTAIEQALAIIEAAIIDKCDEVRRMRIGKSIPDSEEYADAMEHSERTEMWMRSQVSNLRVALRGRILTSEQIDKVRQ